MQYKFIHHWQYEQNERERQVLEQALELANAEKTPDYLTQVASFLTAHTGATYVVIGLLQQDKEHIQTLVFLQDGQVLPNLVYSLQGTPCEAVSIQGFCFYPLQVSQLFPQDRDLTEMQVESYLGTMLFSPEDEPIGIVAIMDTKTLPHPAFTEHLILVLSLSIEEELGKVAASSSPMPASPPHLAC
ncbi:MAG: hypothetical protein ACO1NZ_06845 [Adhaeribacter sp.]